MLPGDGDVLDDLPVRAVLGGAIGCATVLDPSGRHPYANRDYLDVVGRTVLEVLGEEAALR